MSRRTPISEQKTVIIQRPRQRPMRPANAAGQWEAPAEVHVPAPIQDRRRVWPWILLLSLALLTAVLAVAFTLFQTERILPGVETLGVTLGGKSIDQATTLLANNWDSRRVALQDGETRIAVSPAELGIILDAEATARSAYRQGRAEGGVTVALRGLLQGHSFVPVWHFDPAIASARLAQVATHVDRDPVNGGVRFAGGRVEPTAALSGRRLDVTGTVSWLQENAAQVVLEGQLSLLVETLEPAVTDMEEVIRRANELLAQPITIHTFDPVQGQNSQMDVPPAIWTSWLTLGTVEANAGDLQWHVDQSAAVAYFEQQAASLGEERYVDTTALAAALAEAIRTQNYQVRTRIYHRSRLHTVQDGETLSSIAYQYGIPYPWIQQANPGVADGLYPGQEITIPSPDLLLPLPVVENKRVVVSLSQQRMWAYEDGRLIWDWPVSTGIDSSPTAPGVFQIQSHEPNAYAGNWDLWMPNFMGIYRPVPTSDFMNGFHGFPTRNGNNLLWTNSLGRKVTYGCILVSNENVTRLYEWAEDGVVVEVQP